MDYGLWIMDYGLWIMDYGLFIIIHINFKPKLNKKPVVHCSLFIIHRSSFIVICMALRRYAAPVHYALPKRSALRARATRGAPCT
jgi:hypothetical protein